MNCDKCGDQIDKEGEYVYHTIAAENICDGCFKKRNADEEKGEIRVVFYEG